MAVSSMSEACKSREDPEPFRFWKQKWLQHHWAVEDLRRDSFKSQLSHVCFLFCWAWWSTVGQFGVRRLRTCWIPPAAHLHGHSWDLAPWCRSPSTLPISPKRYWFAGFWLGSTPLNHSIRPCVSSKWNPCGFSRASPRLHFDLWTVLKKWCSRSIRCGKGQGKEKLLLSPNHVQTQEQCLRMKIMFNKWAYFFLYRNGF